jgi:hypothetical protein
MADSRTLSLGVLIAFLVVGVLYLVDPSLGGLLPAIKRLFGMEGFEDAMPTPGSNPTGGVMDAAAATVGAITGNPNSAGGDATVVNPPAAAEAPARRTGGSTNGAVAGFTGSSNEGFMDLAPSPMPFPAAGAPANCYPKNQLKPEELLPSDPNSKWAQVNPSGSGDISGKNFLSAGTLIGIDTVGQSLRNANYDLRADIPNPMGQWPIMQSTIGPDIVRRPLE